MRSTEQVEIEDGAGVTYVVQGTDLSSLFTAVSAETQARGEALIEKVNQLAPGRIEIVTRLQDGVREDSPDGIPAVQVLDKDGLVSTKARYRNGRNTDVNGQPAFQQFEPGTGRLVAERHAQNGVVNDTPDAPAVMIAYAADTVSFQRYTNGRRNDGANGEPAIQQFTSEGVLMSQHRYKDGLLHDGAKGEPGYQKFDAKGRLTESFHCKEGLMDVSTRAQIRNFVRRKLHR